MKTRMAFSCGTGQRPFPHLLLARSEWRRLAAVDQTAGDAFGKLDRAGELPSLIVKFTVMKPFGCGSFPFAQVSGHICGSIRTFDIPGAAGRMPSTDAK